MFKINHNLQRTIFSKKMKLVFFSFFVLFLLSIAQPTYAILGVGDIGLFDLAGIQLDALDFVDSSVLQYIIFLIILTAESAIFAVLSANFLQWAIGLPIDITNDIVTTGWNFIAGISNSVLILILIFIALAYILKIETFEAKKALPKLILIALLINFSKVFVGVFVDIAQILQNTIAGALGGDFVSLAIDPLIQSSLNLLGWLTGIIASYKLAALIPYGNVVALVALVTLLITGTLLEVIMKIIVLNIFNFAITIVFLFFTGLFLMRVAIIWILAIFAPLAFVAFILKDTKKHWDKWLNMLVEWSFLGIVVLFLLGLGLKMFALIVSEPPAFSMNVLRGTFVLPEFIYYYLFLLVYLGVVFHLSKQNMPKFAEALIGQAKTLGGRGGKMLGKPMAKRLTRMAATQEAREKAAKDIKGWKGRRLRFESRLTKPFSAPVRWAYRVAGTTPELATSKNVDSSTKKFEKKFGKEIKEAIKIHGGKVGFKFLTSEEKAGFALYLAKVKGGKGINSLDIEKQREAVKEIIKHSPAQLENLIKQKSELIEDPEVGDVIQRIMVSDRLEKDDKGEYKDADVKELAKLGYDKAELIKKAAFKKAVDALKTNDIETLSKETIDNVNFYEMAARFKNWSFIRKLGEERGSEYVEKIQEKAEKIGLKKIAETNASFIKAPYSPGGQLIMRQWKKEDGTFMKRRSDAIRLITEAREEARTRQVLRSATRIVGGGE